MSMNQKDGFLYSHLDGGAQREPAASRASDDSGLENQGDRVNRTGRASARSTRLPARRISLGMYHGADPGEGIRTAKPHVPAGAGR